MFYFLYICSLMYLLPSLFATMICYFAICGMLLTDLSSEVRNNSIISPSIFLLLLLLHYNLFPSLVVFVLASCVHFISLNYSYFPLYFYTNFSYLSSKLFLHIYPLLWKKDCVTSLGIFFI